MWLPTVDKILSQSRHDPKNMANWLEKFQSQIINEINNNNNNNLICSKFVATT